MTATAATTTMWAQDGNDDMHGGDDNDDMYGELGNDRMFGDAGQDAMLGDRGVIVEPTHRRRAGVQPFTVNGTAGGDATPPSPTTARPPRRPDDGDDG